jgi:hypothetical protein
VTGGECGSGICCQGGNVLKVEEEPAGFSSLLVVAVLDDFTRTWLQLFCVFAVSGGKLCTSRL